MQSNLKGHRLGFLKVVAALVVLALVAIRLWPDLESNLQFFYTVIVTFVALLLVLIWFLCLSRLRWVTRLLGVVIFALAIFGIGKAVRVDGTVNGTGFPILAWKWSPTHKPAPILATAITAVPGTASDIPDVPQFFGPKRDGVITGAKLARDWNAAPPKQLWRQPIGAGWSAFAVVGGRAFTQEQRGENEAVTCYDVRTGKLLWVHENPAHFSQWQAGDGPHGTPTVDRGLVFAYGATGILDCLDATTGKCLWTRNVLQENNLKNLIWAVSASPLVFEETVVITGGDNAGPTVLAFIRATGEPLWKGGADRASYASPIRATLAGKSVVLSVNAASFTAHDFVSGEVLLSFPWTDGSMPKAAQPVVLPGDRVFLSAGYGAGCMVLQIKADAGGKLAATQLWKNMRMKNQFNSVALRDGHLYGLDDGGLACVSVETGERQWKGGHYGSGQSLLVDDLLLVQTEPGPIVLAEAKPDAFHELGRIDHALSSKTWNHPTLAGRYLLVRNDQEVVCYELPVVP